MGTLVKCKIKIKFRHQRSRGKWFSLNLIGNWFESTPANHTNPWEESLFYNPISKKIYFIEFQFFSPQNESLLALWTNFVEWRFWIIKQLFESKIFHIFSNWNYLCYGKFSLIFHSNYYFEYLYILMSSTFWRRPRKSREIAK